MADTQSKHTPGPWIARRDTLAAIRAVISEPELYDMREAVRRLIAIQDIVIDAEAEMRNAIQEAVE